MKPLLLLLFLVGIAATGCVTQDTNTTAAEKRVTTDPGRVAILYSRPERAFEDLGRVTTTKRQPPERQSWQTVLRDQAAAMGADAVLIDTSTLNNSNTPMVFGSAIRFPREKP